MADKMQQIADEREIQNVYIRMYDGMIAKSRAAQQVHIEKEE